MPQRQRDPGSPDDEGAIGQPADAAPSRAPGEAGPAASEGLGDELYRPTQRIPRVSSDAVGAVPPSGPVLDAARPAEAPTRLADLAPSVLEQLDADAAPPLQPVDQAHPERHPTRGLIPILLVAVASLGTVIGWSLIPGANGRSQTATAPAPTPRVGPSSALSADPLPPYWLPAGDQPTALPRVSPMAAPTVSRTVIVTPTRSTATAVVTVTATPTPTAPTSAATSPSASPSTAVSTPATSPVNGWQLSLGGAGPVLVGMPAAQAAALGYLVATPTDPSGYTTAPPYASHVQLVVLQGVVDGVIVRDPALSTAQGAHVGVQQAALAATYGPQLTTLPTVDSTGTAWPAPGMQTPQSYIAFPLGADGTVAQIVIGVRHAGSIVLPVQGPSTGLIGPAVG